MKAFNWSYFQPGQLFGVIDQVGMYHLESFLSVYCLIKHYYVIIF